MELGADRRSFAFAAFGLAAFVVWESRHDAPLVDVSLFRRAPFTVANLAGLAVFFAFIGAIVYLSAYFQQVQGRSALAAGLAVLPIGLGFFVSAQLSGRIVGRLCLTPMTATAMAAVRSERAGMASAVHNSMRQVGQALGVAVLGSLVRRGRRGPGRRGTAFGHAGDRIRGRPPSAVLVSGACLLVAALLAALLIPRGLLGRM